MIGETLAGDSSQGGVSALAVRNLAIVVPKVELTHVSLQMLRGAVSQTACSSDNGFSCKVNTKE